MSKIRMYGIMICFQFSFDAHFLHLRVVSLYTERTPESCILCVLYISNYAQFQFLVIHLLFHLKYFLKSPKDSKVKDKKLSYAFVLHFLYGSFSILFYSMVLLAYIVLCIPQPTSSSFSFFFVKRKYIHNIILLALYIRNYFIHSTKPNKYKMNTLKLKIKQEISSATTATKSTNSECFSVKIFSTDDVFYHVL